MLLQNCWSVACWHLFMHVDSAALYTHQFIFFSIQYVLYKCFFNVCSAISVELYYIFATVWGREQFTLYGILFVVYIILLSVTACVAVALTYFQLSGEDHRWWWRSIFSAG